MPPSLALWRNVRAEVAAFYLRERNLLVCLTPLMAASAASALWEVGSAVYGVLLYLADAYARASEERGDPPSVARPPAWQRFASRRQALDCALDVVYSATARRLRQRVAWGPKRASPPPPWEDETCVGLARLPAHAPLRLFRDTAAAASFWAAGGGAVAAEAALSPAAPRRLLLSSDTWRFRLAPSPEAVPRGFASPSFDDTTWATVVVPHDWQLPGMSVVPGGHAEPSPGGGSEGGDATPQGGFDTPIYTNITYPFDVDLPRAARRGTWRSRPRSSGGGGGGDGGDEWVWGREPSGEPPNPTGCYRRSFAAPPCWAGSRVVVRIDGADSCVLCWVNGVLLGYSQDSRLPAEFDATSCCIAGGVNVLALQVMRFCDGSYLEDQDAWRLSGLFRDVSVYSTPLTFISDYAVTTNVPDAVAFDGAGGGDATVSVSVDVVRHAAPGCAAAAAAAALPPPPAASSLHAASHPPPPPPMVRASLHGPRGSLVWRGLSPPAPPCAAAAAGYDVADAAARAAGAGGAGSVQPPAVTPAGADAAVSHCSATTGFRVSFDIAVPNPRLWSAETPELYVLVLELVHPGGAGDRIGGGGGDAAAAGCVETCRVGIRTVAVGHKCLLVNGRRVTIAGVNRHEHSPSGGRTVDEALMEADVAAMKGACACAPVKKAAFRRCRVASTPLLTVGVSHSSSQACTSTRCAAPTTPTPPVS